MEQEKYTILKWLSKVRHDNRLTTTERLILMEIESLSHEKGFCYASNEYIGKIFGIEKGTVSTAVSKLKKYGYITRTVKKSDNSRKIFLVDVIENNQLAYQEKSNSLSKKSIDTNTKRIQKDNISTVSKVNNQKSFSTLLKSDFIDQEIEQYNLNVNVLEKAKQYCLDNMNYNSSSYIKRCIEEKWYEGKKQHGPQITTTIDWNEIPKLSDETF